MHFFPLSLLGFLHRSSDAKNRWIFGGRNLITYNFGIPTSLDFQRRTEERKCVFSLIVAVCAILGLFDV